MNPARPSNNIPSTVIDGNDKRIPKRIVRIVKAPVPNTAGAATGAGASRETSYTACRNPLDRFCQLLLPARLYQQSTVDPATGANSNSVQQIPLKFASIDEYMRTWEPLLVQEVKDKILNGIGLIAKGSCAVGTITLVQAPEISESSSGITKLTFVLQEKDPSTSRDRLSQKEFTSLDLLLISTQALEFPLRQSMISQSHCLLGLITSHSKIEGSVVAVDKERWRNFREFGSKKRAFTGEMKRATEYMSESLHYVVVESMISPWREFLSLHQIDQLPSTILHSVLGTGEDDAVALSDPLRQFTDASKREGSTPPPAIPPASADEAEAKVELSPLLSITSSPLPTFSPRTPSPTPKFSPRTPRTPSPSPPEDKKQIVDFGFTGVTDTFVAIFKHRFNISQLKAISAGVNNVGITAIQGPPGTGKTTTIIGLLNALHIRQYYSYYETLLATALGEEGQKCCGSDAEKKWVALVASISRSKPHILVAAPSNVAVDNIVQRIMEKGFYDGKGQKYFPNILRIGGGKSEHVNAVSLEDSMEQILGMQEFQKEEAFSQLSAHICSIVNNISRLQHFLLVLKSAWSACCPLPPEWELRISCEQSQVAPYWVDHTNKRTQMHPPTVNSSQLTSSWKMTIEAMPEYIIYSEQLTEALEQLFNANLQRVRFRTSHETKGYSRHEIRQAIENSVIEEAHVVFTTLNSAGHSSLETSIFSTTVVDEAGQCVEPSVLIPLRLGSKSCVLVGDHRQLPATSFSKYAKLCGYDRSLFERTFLLAEQATEAERSKKIIMLDTQYRMLPEISAFPSKMFYNGNLRNGDNVLSQSYRPSYIAACKPGEFIKIDGPLLRPFMFFDLKTSHDQLGTSLDRSASAVSQSRSNLEEAKLCVSLVKFVLSEANLRAEKIESIGVITPYQDQLSILRREFRSSGLISALATSSSASNVYDLSSDQKPHIDQYDIELNTVDAFQGREKDIIVFSCVRAEKGGGIGFLSDTRRMNVAITRGRHGVFVVGKAKVLRDNPFWDQLITHARETHSLVYVESSKSNLTASLRQQHHHKSFQQPKGGSRKKGGHGGRFTNDSADRISRPHAAVDGSSSRNHSTVEELEEGEIPPVGICGDYKISI